MLEQWVSFQTDQWVDDNLLQWAFTTSSGPYYNKIYIDAAYVYSSVNNILTIYLSESSTSIATVTYGFDITSLYSNNTYLFIGTYEEGVKYFDISILETFISAEDIYNATLNYSVYPNITGNHIRYISGAQNYLTICTSFGLDFLKLEPNGYRSCTTNSNIYNSFILSERELFYTVSGTYGWEIYQKDPITDWNTTTPILNNTSGAVAYVTNIKDLKVNKTIQNGTTLFFLTDLGICVYNMNSNDFFYID